jgi:16S rRNA (cytidine1402-2'-O)-methyltransferase
MSARRGTVYLVPNTLDFGLPGESLPEITEVLPLGSLRVAARLAHWVTENAKSTRAFLKRVNDIVPLSRPLQAIDIVELPRPPKGRPTAPPPDLSALLAPALRGEDLGVLSEAGMPAVADPGALLVRAAHAQHLAVTPLSGPSALIMALAASGLEGQSFAFVGYLPVQGAERATRIHELEALSRRAAQTQLLIETPYRNAPLLDALLAQLAPSTRLSISCGLTFESGWCRTATVAEWKMQLPRLPNNVPAVFALLAA